MTGAPPGGGTVCSSCADVRRERSGGVTQREDPWEEVDAGTRTRRTRTVEGVDDTALQGEVATTGKGAVVRSSEIGHRENRGHDLNGV